MRRRFTPLVFDEVAWLEVARKRRWQAAPTGQLTSTQRKATQKMTPYGLAVDSFQGLLEELAPLTNNETRLTGRADGTAFRMQSHTTAVPTRTSALLRVQP